jgi:hypothetical protein
VQPHVPDDRVSSSEGLVKIAQDLTDEEVMQVGRVLHSLQAKYSVRANTPENLDALRDEGLTRLADIGLIASFDPTPCFYGEPPNFEIVGKVPGHEFNNYGLDHEKKQYEVRKATELGEDFRGQKETYNKKRKA